MQNDVTRKYGFEQIDTHLDQLKRVQGLSTYDYAEKPETAIAAQKSILHIEEILRHLNRLKREANNVLRYNSGSY